MDKIWALVSPVIVVVSVALVYRFVMQESVPTVYWAGSVIALGLLYLPLAIRRI